MAVRQRIIKARIRTGITLYHDDYVKYDVYYDSGAPDRSEVLGSQLNYDIESSGGYLGDGIQYTKMYIDGGNGGTTKQAWFQLYFDKTSDYDLATVSLPNGVNNISLGGTSINIDEDDAPDDAFEALFAPTPSYITLRILRGDSSTSTKALTLKDTSELHIYMGYNVSEATLGNPGTPSITVNGDGTYTAKWSAASASGGSGSVYYQWWDVNNGGWWTNWSTATQVTLNIPSYGYPYEFKVRATYDGASSSYEGNLESWSNKITYTFTQPTVTKPGKPTIVQNNDGTFKASWTAATGSNGTGSVKYQLYYGSTAIGSSTTSTSVTANIPGYGTAYSFTVKATYAGVSATSDATSFTFAAATLTKPGAPSVELTTTTYTLNWTPATGTNGSGNVYYRAMAHNKNIATTYASGWQTGLSYTGTIKTSGDYKFYVLATYDNASSETEGNLLTSSEGTELAVVLGSLTQPGAPTIKQNSDGTFTASWTKATGYDNSGLVYYRLYNVTTSTYLSERSTELSATVAIPAYGSAQTYRVMATYGNASASANGDITTWSSDTTHTFSAPSLTTPGAPVITQNNDGTFSANWTRASGLNGSGSVYYQLINTTQGIALNDNTTSNSGTYAIPTYGTELTFQVKATYNNAGAASDGSLVTYSAETKKTFVSPSLSKPVLSIKSTSGTAPELSWTAAVLSNTTGTIYYEIWNGDYLLDYTSDLSITIAEDVIAPFSPLQITVRAFARDLSNNSSGYSLTSDSNAVSFTHQPTFNGASSLSGTGANELKLQWIAGSTSYGKITYSILINNKVVAENIPGSTTTYTVPEELLYTLTSNNTVTLRTYHSITSGYKDSNSISYTYAPIFNGATNLKSNNAGSQAIVTWTAGNVSYGEVVYDLYLNGVKIASDLTSTSYTIFESSFSKASNSIYIVTRAPLHDKSHTSSTITFNYIASVIKHTVGYRQGGRNHNCLVYVCVNGAWIKCAPHVYKNGKWQICSTT